MKKYLPLFFVFCAINFVFGQAPSEGFEGCLTDKEKNDYQELMGRKTNSLAKQFLALSVYRDRKDSIRFEFVCKAISRNFYKGAGSNGTIAHQFPQNTQSISYGVEQFCKEFWNQSETNASIFWHNIPGAGIVKGSCISQVKNTKLKIYKGCPISISEVYSFGFSRLDFSKQIEFRIYEKDYPGDWKMAIERVVTKSMLDPEKECRRSDPRGDADGDGIINKKDKCCLRPGPAPDGCPLVQEGDECLIPNNDDDGDGILNAVDNCCKVPGEKEFGGCPPRDTSENISFSRLIGFEIYAQPQLKRFSHRSTSAMISQPNVVGIALDFFDKKNTRLNNAGIRLTAEIANYAISNLADKNGMFVEEIGAEIDEIRVAEINAALLFTYNYKNNTYTYNTSGSKRIGFNLNIGPQINILNDVDLYKNEERFNLIDPINNTLYSSNELRSDINFAGLLQLGGSYAISQKLYLNISALSTYKFLNIDNEDFKFGSLFYPPSRGKTSDLSIGLQLGLNYKFLNSKTVTKE